MADENGPMLEERKEAKANGAFGLEKTSQPMELRKELAVKVSKLSFRFCIIQLGKFVLCFASYNLAVLATWSRFRL